METCTAIQSRRDDLLFVQHKFVPELIVIFVKIGFDPITLTELFVDPFSDDFVDSCE